ncbi:hypothetical protein HN446_02800 [bacterium]|jgi:hypothetical protein|nr:hypothetical protein [bacterium]
MFDKVSSFSVHHKALFAIGLFIVVSLASVSFQGLIDMWAQKSKKKQFIRYLSCFVFSFIFYIILHYATTTSLASDF